MKPKFENSRQSQRSGASRPSARQNNNHPITDWSFQAAGSGLRGGATPFHPGARQSSLRPAFYTLSQKFFSAEANRESRIEGALFGLIAVLAAWPIALAVQAAAALIK